MMKRSYIDDYIKDQEGLARLSRQALEAMQLEKLNAILTRMHVHGLTHLPKAVQSLSELASLPFTTAADLATAPSRYLLTSQSEVARIITDQTSGTTSAAKRVFYSEEDVMHTVNFFAAGIREMVAPGDGVLITMPFSGALGLGDLIRRAVEKIGAVPLCAGWGKSYEELSALVQHHQPIAYIGFPVPLLSLARYMGDAFSIKRALISGDACPPAVFRLLSERMHLYPHYGSREICMGGAITCPAFGGMHVRENHFIVEIVDEAGRVLPEGEEGELVITTIGMAAMPLLRYRTGDRTRILPEPCPCGSVSKRIAQPFRLGQAAETLIRLDEAVFGVPAVVDCRADNVQGTLRVEALCLTEAQDALCEAVAAIDPRAVVQSRLCRGEDVPLYPGKRILK